MERFLCLLGSMLQALSDLSVIGLRVAAPGRTLSVKVHVLAQETTTMPHPNAPLTVKGRLHLVWRISSSVPIAHVAAQIDILAGDHIRVATLPHTGG